MAKNKKVLIIAYYFPPRQNVGSLRPKGLAKYLPEFGWNPIILTGYLPISPSQNFKVVQTLYPGDSVSILKRKLHLLQDKQLKERIKIPFLKSDKHKTFLTGKLDFSFRCLFDYPDKFRSWAPHAIKTAMKLLKEKEMKLIISTSKPETSHLIAKELKTKYSIPWVADLRDLWTQNHYYPYNSFRKWFERKLEIRTLAFADALVTVSDPLSEKLRKLHRNKPVFTITNGFDPNEIGLSSLTDKLTITYTGQLYKGKQNPEPLLKAINELLKKKIIERNVIEVRFLGPEQKWLEELIYKYQLKKVVRQYGLVDRSVSLKKQRGSQILLLLNWNDLRETGVYTGKIFEYIAAKRPILSIGGPKGVVSELLRETNAGVYVSDLEHLKRILIKWYREFVAEGRVSYNGKEHKIHKYTQREMARKFADVLNKFSK